MGCTFHTDAECYTLTQSTAGFHKSKGRSEPGRVSEKLQIVSDVRRRRDRCPTRRDVTRRAFGSYPAWKAATNPLASTMLSSIEQYVQRPYRPAG